MSTIIENSWEKDYSGMFSDDPDSVLQHLLNWSAAKTIFQLLGKLTILVCLINLVGHNKLLVMAALTLVEPVIHQFIITLVYFTVSGY